MKDLASILVAFLLGMACGWHVTSLNHRIEELEHHLQLQGAMMMQMRGGAGFQVK